VSVAVVDLLEVVDVRDDHAERLCLAGRRRDERTDAVVEGTAIQEAGQGVDHRLLADAAQFAPEFIDLLATGIEPFVDT